MSKLIKNLFLSILFIKSYCKKKSYAFLIFKELNLLKVVRLLSIILNVQNLKIFFIFKFNFYILNKIKINIKFL